MMRRLVCIASALVALAPAAIAAPPDEGDPVHYFSGASTNSTLVRTGPVRLLAIAVVNSTTTIYYLKLYDKATAPTCNSDPVSWTLPILVSTVAPTLVPLPAGLRFFSGLGFCLTGAIADNDNTNAATGVAINFGIR